MRVSNKTMNKAYLITQEKEKLVNQLVNELNNNLALIHDLEDMNDEKNYQIKKLKKEILTINPEFKDHFETQLKHSMMEN